MSPEDSGQATTPVPMAPDSLLPTEDSAAEGSPAAETPMRLGNLRIGRAPDNDLVVDDLIVSRYHAELLRRAALPRRLHGGGAQRPGH